MGGEAKVNSAREESEVTEAASGDCTCVVG